MDWTSQAMISPKPLWILLMTCLAVSFVTGTHFPSWHLEISVPSMVLGFVILALILRNRELSSVVRGSALTLVLLFVFSSLLGWGVLVGTLAPLFHGIGMGAFAIGCVFLSYQIFSKNEGP